MDGSFSISTALSPTSAAGGGVVAEEAAAGDDKTGSREEGPTPGTESAAKTTDVPGAASDPSAPTEEVSRPEAPAGVGTGLWPVGVGLSRSSFHWAAQTNIRAAGSQTQLAHLQNGFKPVAPFVCSTVVRFVFTLRSGS